MTDIQNTTTKVLYNADCPVCSLEIDHYARISETHKLPVAFSNLNEPAALAQWGLDADTAARRLHVQKDGQLYSGIPAFLILWREMPGYRHLARIVNLPGVYRLSVWVYDYALAPLLFQWHIRRIRKSGTS